jgi:hypothetical protein
MVQLMLEKALHLAHHIIMGEYCLLRGLAIVFMVEGIDPTPKNASATLAAIQT